MGRSKDDEKVAFKKGYNITSKQLKKWGVKFHVLKMEKPSFDLILKLNLNFRFLYPFFRIFSFFVRFVYQ